MSKYNIYDVNLSKQNVVAGERLIISVDVITWDWLKKQVTWGNLKSRFKWGDLLG